MDKREKTLFETYMSQVWVTAIPLVIVLIVFLMQGQVTLNV